MRTKGHERNRRRGFSLLELLAVMSIMAMLTALAVTSYFNAIRGMTRRSAVKHFANSLILARQRACLEGVRVSVMVFNEITGYNAKNEPEIVPSYVVCKETGRITYEKPPVLGDEFASLDKMFPKPAGMDMRGSYLGSMRLYNLTQGKWWNVYPWTEPTTPKTVYSAYLKGENGKPLRYSLVFNCFTKNANVKNSNEAAWDVGDMYGVEAAPPGSLPKGFEFRQLGDDVDRVVCFTFMPDGTAYVAGNKPRSIEILELMPPNTKAEVKVEADGSVNYK